MFRHFLLIFVFVLFTPLSNADARKYTRIVGSSTVFPFISFVAEEFNRVFSFKTPVVESIGSGSGFKMFCSGIGEDTPDITTSSRPMKEVERDLCKRNKINQIRSSLAMMELSLQIQIKAIDLISQKRTYLKLYLHIFKKMEVFRRGQPLSS